MHKIIEKKELAKDITRMVFEAPLIARKAEAGQFVVLIIDEKGERIPLTIADFDREKGTITLIFQKVGYTTRKLGMLNAGDLISDLLGPLGHPTEAKKIGTVVTIGGGAGIAEVYPVARVFKKCGNRVIGIIGSRSKDLLILENEMRGVCDELFITTDDGSSGRKGFVIDVLKELFTVIEKSAHTEFPALVYCIGPVPMMKAVADFTRDFGVKTIANLNPVMVDATGMCGSCRCTVGGKTVFGCVDGPEFDAHQVDFVELGKRTKLFCNQEKTINEKLTE
ncbi:MAG: sulfide/dihydroorotate dehydrogenase-like FAD/NAD-binding protein [Candidatus Omnitrophota bacterium]|nr:MAG: sulfide/dihydroorotate dehydrogenase-like FAD/NAD-binding protein [Candidatus Omnitrophota bacterium]